MLVNIGNRPTFSGIHTSIEAHILDFSQNIYGQSLLLKLDFPIRNEVAFKSVAELQSQIENDIGTARILFRKEVD